MYDKSQKIVKRLGVLTMPALKHYILRESFSEMFDSLAINISSGGFGHEPRRTDGIKVSGLFLLERKYENNSLSSSR